MGRRCVVAAVAALVAWMSLTTEPAAETHEPKGRRVFDAKQCGQCHVAGGRADAVPPVEALRRPKGAWELTGRFWNHVPGMFTALGASSVAWPQFTPDEMTDLMTYLGAKTDADQKADPARGLTVLVQKGCLKCHALHGEGARLAPDLATRTVVFEAPATWATRIWAHAPVMASVALREAIQFPRFGPNEMVHLVEYLKTRGAAPAGR